jgi:DNA-binding GntR family transcriptional regulator
MGGALNRKLINRGTLHDEVTAVLRDMIIQGELAPGKRIPEKALCERLGISRTPLREALRVLASEGLITPLPRRGAIVAEPSSDEIQGVFYAIAAIESICAKLACENISDAEIENVLKLQARLVHLIAKGQQRTKEYSNVNQGIHEAIVKGAGNAFLGELHRSLVIRILRVRYFIDVDKSTWDRAVEEHEQIADCLKRRDGKKLSEAISKHIMGSWRVFEKTLNIHASQS